LSVELRQAAEITAESLRIEVEMSPELADHAALDPVKIEDEPLRPSALESNSVAWTQVE